MDCSRLGSPFLHYLLEFANSQTKLRKYRISLKQEEGHYTLGVGDQVPTQVSYGCRAGAHTGKLRILGRCHTGKLQMLGRQAKDFPAFIA